MTASFVIRLIMFVLLFVALVAAVLTRQFGLALPYLCLAPWIGLWLGRATVGMFAGYRITRASPASTQPSRPFRQRN